jgi:hypothetical protein
MPDGGGALPVLLVRGPEQFTVLRLNENRFDWAFHRRFHDQFFIGVLGVDDLGDAMLIQTEMPCREGLAAPDADTTGFVYADL